MSLPLVGRVSKAITPSDTVILDPQPTYFVVENRHATDPEIVYIATQEQGSAALVTDNYSIPAGGVVEFYCQLAKVLTTTGADIVVHGIYE